MVEEVESALDKSAEELERICRSVLQSSSILFQNVQLVASFHPYVGLTHTIRRKAHRWVIRVSDHCRQAPRPVLEAIATLLACKILRRRPPKGAVEVYAHFRDHPEIAAAVQARRRQLGRKRMKSSGGTHHPLDQIYREIDGRYFNNQLNIRKLGWSSRSSWTRLGHYDPVHHSITISPVLDSPKVPRSVVCYIVYHEMLHALFEGTVQGCRSRHHPAEFRRAERAYPGFAAAKKFLDDFCRTRGKITAL